MKATSKYVGEIEHRSWTFFLFNLLIDAFREGVVGRCDADTSPPFLFLSPINLGHFFYSTSRHPSNIVLTESKFSLLTESDDSLSPQANPIKEILS